MSFTFTNDSEIYVEMIAGFELDFTSFAKFVINKNHTDEEMISEHSLVDTFNLYLNIEDINQMYEKDNVKFYYSRNKFIMGIKIMEFDEFHNSIEPQVFENLDKYKNTIVQYLKNNSTIKRFVIKGFKIHCLF